MVTSLTVMSNHDSAKSETRKLIFYNKKDKRLLIINGEIRQEPLEAIIYLKPHMRLYGVVKMICLNEKGSKIEYEVLGIDKMKEDHSSIDSTIPYKVYLSPSRAQND